MRHLVQMLRYSRRHATFAAAVLVAALAAGVSCPGTAIAVSPSPQLLGRMAHSAALRQDVTTRLQRAHDAGVDVPPIRTYGPGSRVVPNTGGIAVAGSAAMAPALQAAAAANRPFHLLVLLVDFSDNVHTVATSSFDNLMFGDVTGPSSVRGYYREVSAGGIDIQCMTSDLPSAIGWLRMPHTYSYYVGTSQGMSTNYPRNSQGLLADACAAAAAKGVNFSNYDNDGDGVVDGVVLIHAGTGAENTGLTTQIWSHSWDAHSPQPSYNGVTVGPYSTEPEYWVAAGDMTTGVYCHEIGHTLGLPDLYDTTYASRGLGQWSIMAAGSWNGPDGWGASPARFDAWSLMKLGFDSAIAVTQSVAPETIVAADASREGTIVRVEKNGATGGKEYFLVENRQMTGTDSYLPGSGLLIYHVDENRTDNDTASHYMVGLEEAHGGVQDLHVSTSNIGDDGDPYPGSSQNASFTDSTDPSAAYFTGASNIAILVSGSSATTMTATVATDPNALTGDVAPPVTTLRSTPASNAAGWNRTDVLVGLTATDTGGSGVASIYYGLNAPATVSYVSTVTVSSEGTTTFNYRSVDGSGNPEATRTATVKIDKTPPSVTGSATTSPNAAGWYHSAVTVHFSATDATSGVSSISPDAVLSSQGASLSVLGTAVDRAGNTATVTVANLNVDTTLPSLSLDATASYTGTATVHASASDALSGLARVECNLDASGWTSGTVVTTSTLGIHTLSARAFDVAGNERDVNATFTVVPPDTIPPVTSLRSTPASNAAGWNRTDVLVGLTATDTGGSGVASIYYGLNAPATVSYVSTVTVSSEGTTTFNYRSVDGSGNPEATRTATVKIDKTPPSVTGSATTSPNAAGWYHSAVTVHFSATDATSGVSSISPDAVLSSQGASLSVLGTAVDRAGNTATVTVANLNVDTTLPSLSLDATASYTGTATVHASASDALSGLARVECNLDASGWTSGTVVTTSTLGIHTLSARAFDVAGNERDVNATFTVVPLIDHSPPVTSSDATATYEGSATISLTATDTGGSGVASTQWILDTVSGEGTSVVEPFYGAHTLSFWSTDVAGNTETPTVVGFFVQDVGLPQVSSDAMASYVGAAAISLTATDAPTESGVASLSYQLDGATTQTVPATQTTVDATGGGTHQLVYWATDVAGNPSAVETRSFTIFATTDIRLSASATTVTAGQAVRLTGSINLASALDPVAGQRLRLQRRSGTAWVSAGVADAVATSDGAFAFSVKPTQNTGYRAIVAPGSGLLPGTSGAVTVHVRAVLSTPKVPSNASANQYFSATGSTSPNVTFVLVSWYRVSRAGKLTAYGRAARVWVKSNHWSLRKRLAPGRWAVRATHMDWNHAWSSSAARVFRVR